MVCTECIMQIEDVTTVIDSKKFTMRAGRFTCSLLTRRTCYYHFVVVWVGRLGCSRFKPRRELHRLRRRRGLLPPGRLCSSLDGNFFFFVVVVVLFLLVDRAWFLLFCVFPALLVFLLRNNNILFRFLETFQICFENF